ncbi:macrophage migration inhibitory factor-like [Physella acuta]|uniref:macrophage migration inhibitory factor-like n=1 Tax=Physella acuta TaxID=109671 RepID=UPI0027DB91E3|nr:macrophage migration inhibitory factor-like [Physella acuta]
MPVFSIATNLKRDQIPENFVREASKFIASELKKPESYVLVQISPDQLMTFGGSDEPCANISLSSIGVVCADKNRKMASKLCQFIEQHLGIKQNRFYINVHDIDAAWCIWNGTTFG